MSNSLFDWPASPKRFVKFDTARSEDVNDALDSVSAGMETVEQMLTDSTNALQTAVVDAQLAADAAAYTAIAGVWVSGKSYAPYEAAISPLSMQAYRCIATVASSIDPASDPTHWVSLVGRLANTTFTGSVTEQVVTGSTGSAYTFDLNNGSIYYLTLTANCVYTFPEAVAGRTFMLFQQRDATPVDYVTWPSTVKWPGGFSPALTSGADKVDVFAFVAIGGYWFGTHAGSGYL